MYTATGDGRIFSWKRGGCKELSIYNSKQGYQTIQLSKNGETIAKNYTVHRIIASAWLTPPEGLNIVNLVVNHKDSNKRNNHYQNLEYVTQRENVNHAYKNGRGVKNKKIIQADLNGNFIAAFDSMVEAQKETGISRFLISQTCVGKRGRRQAVGYLWCYAEDFEEGKGIKQHGGTTHSVLQYTLDGTFVKKHASLKEAAKSVGKNQGTIGNVCRGTQISAAGFKWKYAPIVKTEKINPLIEETKDWIVLDDYPRYKISKDGRIYSMTHQTIMKGSTTEEGRRSVTISDKNKKLKTMYVHRLVAFAYLDNPNNYPIINHISGDPSDNSVENLEWCTYSQNSRHAYDTGLNNNKSGVSRIGEDGIEIERFDSIANASRATGISPSYIQGSLKNRPKTDNTNKWVYT